jgi:hypothetical protein
MNDMQHEQLFTDLTPAQAETTAGGRPIDDGGFGPGGNVNASYGRAFATFRRTGQGSLTGSLFVKDKAIDGHLVYARFQGLTSDGRILNSSNRFEDKQGAARKGTNYSVFNVNFGNIRINSVRVTISRDNPGTDLFTAGKFVVF